jgi:hypothetical protein
MKLARRKIALELGVSLQTNRNMFIEAYHELKRCLKMLISEPEKTLNLNDLERLYHSCRRQAEVAKETFEMLKVRRQ